MKNDVLIVDDAPAVAASAAAALSPAFAVRVAHTVDAAVDAISEARPAVVVLDLSLDRPADALHTLLGDTPVVVVSGLDTDAARGLATSRGWRALEKPFVDADLRAEVAEALAARQRGSSRSTEAEEPAALPAPPASPSEPQRSASGTPVAHDPTRDRIRVVADRLLYFSVIVAIVILKLRHELDVSTVAALLLVAGIRPHNLFELATSARGGGARAAVALLSTTALESIRSGTVFGR